MSMVTGIEPAPDFPNTDLTDANARLLEMMLGNIDEIEQGHFGAENLSWVFRAGHPAVREAGRRLLVDTVRMEAFDHGIRTYETIATLVQSLPENCDMFTVNSNAVALISAYSDSTLLNYIDAARQHFTEELPLTAQIVRDSSTRFYPLAAEYAVYGAATALQFELDAVA